MHIYPRTPIVKVLVGVRDERGVLQFPQNNPPLPGIDLSVDIGLPISAQLIERLAAQYGISEVTVVQEFKDTCTTANGSEAELYLAFGKTIDPVWALQTLPALVRSLPNDRGRLPYLRAFQIFAGAHRDELKVAEVDDVLKPN